MAQDTDDATGEQYVRWAYRLLLGREPESLAAVRDNRFKTDRLALVESILSSQEFNSQIWQSAENWGNPFCCQDEDAVAFIHLPKSGGTTFHKLLEACFPKELCCPQRLNRLHLYSPTVLSRYKLFSGHFDCYSLCFIPKKRVRRVSLLRQPDRRLVSWYRFWRSHPKTREYEPAIELAQKATPEEFFEHPEIIGSSYTNNTYLFAFGSSLDDHRTLDALVREIQDQPDQAGSQPAKQAAHLEAILARAKAAILGLDAIGLTERFEESVAEIFTTLGLPVPGAIMSEMVTDQLGETIPGFSYVPEVPITPRLSQALWRLTKYDRIIYALAEEEFERRLSPTHADVEPPEWYDHASAPARNYQWGTQRERSDV